MEILDELIRELTSNDAMMWVIGGGEVASENTSKGIKEADLSNGWYTIEADNWHFHLGGSVGQWNPVRGSGQPRRA